MRWRPLTLWLRVGASAVMLGFLVREVNLSSVVPDPDATTPLWLGAALLVTAVGVAVATFRWREVLAALDLTARYRALLSYYLAGLFVGNFLPSTVGGDVVRVRRLARETRDGAGTFASVVIDRLTGWLVLPVITLAALAANKGLRELGSASAVAAGVSIVTLVLLTAVLVVVAHPNLGGRLAEQSGWQRFAGAVHLGVARFRRHRAAVLALLVTAFAYQLVVILTAVLAARALGIDQFGLTAGLAFVPAVSIIQVLPLSLGGLGLREGAFAFFLDPLGVPTGQSVALGFVVYGLQLVVSLLGAPSFAVGGRR